MLTGADLAPRAAPYRLDEAAEGGLSLGEWAARAALPDAGELTAANFGAYAATGLPMLLAFVRPAADNRALVGALRGVAARFRGKLLTAHCDGDAHRDRMLALGLRGGELPQLAFNTKDGRQLPFPSGRTPDEPSLSRFAADFLGERLPAAVEPPPRRGPPKQPENYVPRASDAGAVVEVGAANFSAVALEVGRDVLLQLYSEVGCDACVALVPYYARVAGRLRELSVDSVAVARMDVGVHPMPPLLSSAHRHPLPTVLMLPARRKEPPFAFYDGRARKAPAPPRRSTHRGRSRCRPTRTSHATSTKRGRSRSPTICRRRRRRRRTRRCSKRRGSAAASWGCRRGKRTRRDVGLDLE